MQEAIHFIFSELGDVYPETELRSFSFLILEKITGFSRTEILVNKNNKISDKQRETIATIVDKLKNKEPLQYVLGETEFYGLKFAVDASVLIPRPETEELVEWIHSDFNGKKELKLLDIGTGSGCIAIALSHLHPDWVTDAFDISESALSIARNNNLSNGTSVRFSKVDILTADKMDMKWDIIVSNPPYIPLNEKEEMDANVVEHEPHTALFVPNDRPLLFYEAIARFAQCHLSAGGRLYVEIHRDFGKQCVSFFEQSGFRNIVLKKDLLDNDRMICGENGG